MAQPSLNRVTSTYMYKLNEVGRNSEGKFHHLYYSAQSGVLRCHSGCSGIVYDAIAEDTEAEVVDRAEGSADHCRIDFAIQ